MKICIIDKIGLCYDGNTLKNQGLGGSESAVILIAKELQQLGFEVTVFNNCIDSAHSKPGVYDGVKYIDNQKASAHNEIYDIVIVSRTVAPFLDNSYPFLYAAGKRILWLHDTFIEGDRYVEDLVVQGKINHVFTLSDWHTSYILNANHGKRRNYEVLKRSIFQTRNGAVCHIPEVDLSKKDPNHFVYNASATKGMIPLLEHIWPEIKVNFPNARLTVIGGYYRFREGAEPDEQENTVSQLAARTDLAALDVTFTGVIPQYEIAEILANAWAMVYPGAFPETFGISSLESLLYKTPLVTTRFGALEETAIDLACYHINYAIEPNVLFPEINKDQQIAKFVEMFAYMHNTPYLHQQKQNYCDVVKDIAGWDTVALQWKQFFYSITGNFLPVHEYRRVTRINNKVARVFGRTGNMPAITTYASSGKQRRIVVVSPFWNAENYINKNILSVAQQDYDNYVHILVNDHSSDNSETIIFDTIEQLPEQCKDRIELYTNIENKGCINNQLDAVEKYANDDDIVILLDGDDWLINNNTIFHYYNDLYDQGYEFTYGSMWSVVDNIPLIAQEYSQSIKEANSYRENLFNWKIPYTHLRTCAGKHFVGLDTDKFKVNGKWMKSGHDNPLFYELIEKVNPEKIYCNREIVCNYNDANPLNDYKINTTDQTQNANRSYQGKKKLNKKILIAIPTAKNIEVETFKSIYDLTVPDGYTTEFQYFYGYQIDQIRNLIAEWAKRYDYLFSVDSDIVLPKDTLVKMLAADKDIISGLYIQRIPGTQTVEIYQDTPNGGTTNIPYSLIEGRSIVEVAACGFGCCLINSAVFRKIPYPHFEYKSALTMAGTVSEDVYFCKKARDYGFTVWADPSIKCDHLGSYRFSLDTAVEKNIKLVYSQDLLPKPHIAYLEQLAISPSVIYDIGSCVQHWTRHAERVWPNSQLYLLEANSDVGKLYKETGHRHHIGVLTDHDNKPIKFYKDSMNLGGNSYYKENTVHYNETHAIHEIGKTLDTVAKENNWPFPDLIKIDVQGAELDVLKGAENCLKSCKDIILEAQHVKYNNGAPQVDTVIEYMRNIGFELIAKFNVGDIDGDYHFRKII